MKLIQAAKKRGRPRAFDADAALDKAMRVFWKHGYEGASLPELTRAMGINRPSMYAAFGNKEALFRKALDRYAQKADQHLREAIALPTARQTIEHFVRGAAGMIGSGKVRGCMLVQSALACGEAAEPIRQEVSRRRLKTEDALRQRIERAVSEGDFSAGRDPAAAAKFIATFMNGLAVQSSGGADAGALSAAIDLMLKAFPSGK